MYYSKNDATMQTHKNYWRNKKNYLKGTEWAKITGCKRPLNFV